MGDSIRLDGRLQAFLDTDRDTLEHADAEATETERHFHSDECWWGVAAAPSTPPNLTHAADQIVNQDAPATFQLDGGNTTWGAWVLLFGTDDLPCIAGNTFFDFHRLQVVTVERANATHFIQIARGDEPVGAPADGTFFTVPFHPAAVASKASPVRIQGARITVGEKVWARMLVVGQNTGTLDFYAGTHEYPE